MRRGVIEETELSGSPPVPELGTGETGVVVWHRDDLRTVDHPALAAVSDADAVVPLFVFDPAFYGDGGLACDARIRFLHECLRDLDEGYAARSGGSLNFAHGDPVDVLGEFTDRGWQVIAARTPSGRYGLERDGAAKAAASVQFVSGDGLVRDADRPRENWAERVTEWFEADLHEWDPEAAAVITTDSGVSIDDVEATYGIDPTKEQVPGGGRTAALSALSEFVDRIRLYPGSVSAPLEAREATSGLSPYLSFGCVSVREVYQHVHDMVPECQAREAYTSRLYWNRHYRQKLEDWPGWLDVAVNPELRWFNRDRHDPELVDAWKEGRTGYPMVDAAMRCLRGTGWLNFRMRAMCASFFFHVLQQPWRIGADWFHHHLIDADAGINYTQWQSQCGLVGKPTLRVYDPRKQVRDQDPEGEWIRRWVPELRTLPAEHLDRPERAPAEVQAEAGLEVGEDYPRPVVEYEAATAAFWNRYDAIKGAAAARLGEEAIARRASLSGGIDGARRIADEHGSQDDDGTQTGLGDFG